MNPGSDRLLLSLLFALTASNQHLPSSPGRLNRPANQSAGKFWNR
jgi:hypothetical protein